MALPTTSIVLLLLVLTPRPSTAAEAGVSNLETGGASAAASVTPPDAPSAAGPQGTAEAALASVKTTLDAALEIALGEGTRDEKLVALRGVARDFLDTAAMGRRAVGDVLAAQPAAQQEEYLELFDALMVRAYLQKLLLFRQPRFDYGKPRVTGEKVVVPTKIVTAKDQYGVKYDMRERDGRWLATDVIVEGISLTKNYEEQFASLLRNRTFEELLELMRRKTQPGRQDTE